MENHLPSAHGFQLRDCIRMRSRLADGCALQHGDLVASDDERCRKIRCHRACLGLGEAQGSIACALSGQGGFVNTGRPHLEGKPQPREQAAAVRRGGSEHDTRRVQWGTVF
jgi:hypothetical protein